MPFQRTRGELPKFISRPGDATFPPPYVMRNAGIDIFIVRADEQVLDEVIDRELNQAWNVFGTRGIRHHFKAESSYVGLVLTAARELGQADTAPFAELEFTSTTDYRGVVAPQLEFVVMVPIVDVADDGHGAHRSWYLPFVLTDLPPAVSTGREVYGYPKQWARFTVDDVELRDGTWAFGDEQSVRVPFGNGADDAIREVVIAAYDVDRRAYIDHLTRPADDRSPETQAASAPPGPATTGPGAASLATTSSSGRPAPRFDSIPWWARLRRRIARRIWPGIDDEPSAAAVVGSAAEPAPHMLHVRPVVTIRRGPPDAAAVGAGRAATTSTVSDGWTTSEIEVELTPGPHYRVDTVRRSVHGARAADDLDEAPGDDPMRRDEVAASTYFRDRLLEDLDCVFLRQFRDPNAEDVASYQSVVTSKLIPKNNNVDLVEGDRWSVKFPDSLFVPIARELFGVDGHDCRVLARLSGSKVDIRVDRGRTWWEFP